MLYYTVILICIYIYIYIYAYTYIAAPRGAAPHGPRTAPQRPLGGTNTTMHYYYYALIVLLCTNLFSITNYYAFNIFLFEYVHIIVIRC